MFRVTNHIFQRKLGTLSNDLAINSNDGRAIIIQAVAVTTLLVCIKIDTPTLECRGI